MATNKTGVVKIGTTKNDLLNGTEGDDNLSGGAGNDQLFAGAGDDVLDGGSGADRVDGGSGNDLLIYVATENVGVHDDYDGGSGSDRLRLVLTRDEWLRANVQTDIANYLSFVSSHTNPSGQATGQSFDFNAFNLTATKFEKLEVQVDGKMLLDAKDEAVDARDDVASVSEDAARLTGNVVTGAGATGADVVPDLVKSIQLLTGPAGGTITKDAAGNYTYAASAHGALKLDAAGNFTFTPGSIYNSLGKGKTAVETFTYRLTDADGDTDTAKLTITVVGANDAPIVKTALAAQLANANVSFQYALPGTAFTDPDGDALTYTAKLANGTDLPSWLLFNASTKTFSGTPTADQVGATVSVKVTVSDGNGATASQTFSLHVDGSVITGTNGNDVLNGTDADDRILGLGGNDQLNGLGGNDILDGGDGNDYLRDDSGDNKFIGGAGNDTVETFTSGGATADLGEGDNIFFTNSAQGAVRVTAGSGYDQITLHKSGPGSFVNAGDGANIVTMITSDGSVITGSGFDQISIYGHANVSAGGDTDALFLNGSGTANAGAGDDIIYLGQFSGFDSGHVITTGTGSDRINVTQLNTTAAIVTDFTPGVGGDIVNLDWVLNQDLVGWDHVTNPYGNFSFIRIQQVGNDAVFGIDANGPTGFQLFVPFLVLQNVNAGDLVTQNVWNPGYTFDIFGNPPALSYIGTSGNDVLTGNALVNQMEGNDGNDKLFGNGGNDALFGGLGDDLLNGGDGDDFIHDLDGNTTVIAGAGDDTVSINGGTSANIDGGAGNDNISVFDSGVVTVKGGAGVDSIGLTNNAAGSIVDTRDGFFAGIFITNGANAHTIMTGAGGDYVDLDGVGTATTGAGTDTVFLRGGYSIDTGADSDYITIQAPTGHHTITTGTGADTIVLTTLTPNLANVTDFTKGAGGDAIDLRSVLTATPTAGTLSQFVKLTSDGANGTILAVDADGSGGASAFVNALVLQNTSGLNAADMVNNGNLLVA